MEGAVIAVAIGIAAAGIILLLDEINESIKDLTEALRKKP